MNIDPKKLTDWMLAAGNCSTLLLLGGSDPRLIAGRLTRLEAEMRRELAGLDRCPDHGANDCCNLEPARGRPHPPSPAAPAPGSILVCPQHGAKELDEDGICECGARAVEPGEIIDAVYDHMKERGI